MEGNYLDLGIVVYQTGDGSGTYVDGGGRTQDAGTMSTSAFVDGVAFQAGRGDALVSALHIARSGVTTVDVQLLQKRNDRNNPSLFGWAPVQTTRSDTGVAAYAQSFATTDSSDVTLTCSPAGGGSFKWQVKVTGSPAAGDLVAIGAATA